MIFVRVGGGSVCTVVCTVGGHTIASVNRAGGEKTGGNASDRYVVPDTRPEAASPAPTGSPASPRTWVRRLSAARDRIRAHPRRRRVYRLVVGLVGFGIVAGGIALLPLPGPGWVIVFLGLHVLATEFTWAAALERFARDRVAAWTAWLRRQPLLVRITFGVLMVLVVLGVVYGLLVLSGVPNWVPDWLVPPLPGLT